VNIKPLQPHQQRVVQERDDLQERTTKLDAFIQSPLFKTVDPAEQTRLGRQSALMHDLLLLLNERIAVF
jgi:hypothetical protein